MELPFISEFRNEPRIIWHIYFKDLLIIMGFFLFGYMFRGIVNPKLSTYFVIFNVIVGIMLCQKSQTNPKKRTYEALFILLAKDKKIYKPVIVQKGVLGRKEGKNA